MHDFGNDADWNPSPVLGPAHSVAFAPSVSSSAGGGSGGDFSFASVLSPLMALTPLLTARSGKKAPGVARGHSSAMMPAVGGGIPLWMIVGGGIVVLGGLMMVMAGRE